MLRTSDYILGELWNILKLSWNFLKFFYKYETYKEENKILKFLEVIANTVVISWFTFDANKFTLSFKYINDNFQECLSDERHSGKLFQKKFRAILFRQKYFGVNGFGRMEGNRFYYNYS